MGVAANPVRYNKTAVLLMYWDKTEDDLEIADEVSTSTCVVGAEHTDTKSRSDGSRTFS